MNHQQQKGSLDSNPLEDYTLQMGVFSLICMHNNLLVLFLFLGAQVLKGGTRNA
jgi:hypothetical protein